MSRWTLLEQMLKTHEGFSPDLYRDSEGVLTIGYGTNVGDGISKKEAEALMRSKIATYENRLRKEVGYQLWKSLSKLRKTILLNMAYNMGVDGLMTFKKMFKALENEDYERAAEEMIESKWHGQVGERAEYLSHAMKTGYVPSTSELSE